MARLELRHIAKQYGNDTIALHDISLQTDDHEFIAIVGPSGCGKTTLLRIVAGLEQPDSGSVLMDDQAIEHRSPRDRDVAMVFQGESLYPHLSAFNNIAFPLRMRRVPATEIQARVEETAEQLSIAELLKRMPNELSGGQRQRVAIGRALVRKPKVFLMDEPFSHLDTHLRRQLREELLRLRENWDATTLFVTHDHQEATALGQRVAVINDGVLHQFDHPDQVHASPATEFVAEFMCAGY